MESDRLVEAIGAAAVVRQQKSPPHLLDIDMPVP
jgi:hypothetical protein